VLVTLVFWQAQGPTDFLPHSFLGNDRHCYKLQKPLASRCMPQISLAGELRHTSNEQKDLAILG
jgi:hypothetical protein